MATNRYSRLISNGSFRRLPLVTISDRDSDYYEKYIKGRTSLDNLSYKYYNDPNYVWLLLMANQQYGSLEYSIPDGALLRIPFPLESVLAEYDTNIVNMLQTYGYN